MRPATKLTSALAMCAASLLAHGHAANAATCPPSGGALRIDLDPPAGMAPVVAVVFGTLGDPACEQPDARLADGYAVRLACDSARPDSCRAMLGGLRPGRWVHRILVTEGEPTGQLQGREQLVLDATAGTHALHWLLYRSVATLSSLADASPCQGCLRAALLAADAAPKPALIQFAPEIAGSIVLAAPLPELAAGGVTIDGFDADGRPHTRTVDANGLDAAALKIVSPSNALYGLRIVNTGGDSDVVLVEGPEANDNLLDTLEVVGRAIEPCSRNDVRGCVVGGVCVTPSPQEPGGQCGDDAIAVRAAAGRRGVNVVRTCDIRGAHDKGVKVSDGAEARVERSHVTDNADGGLQATLGGRLTAVENAVLFNQGTNSANGIAANGAMPGSLDAAILETFGNLSSGNALRGISIRSLSIAYLHDDFVCGNGFAGRGNGFGLAVLDAADRSATAHATGLAIVHNVDGGGVVSETSEGQFGDPPAPGLNVFAFNGPLDPMPPANLRNQTPRPLSAIGNHWEHCGRDWTCDTQAVRTRDVFAPQPEAAVAVDPARPSALRRPPVITRIEPPFAAVGDLVRLYGSGFDAIAGNAPDGTCEEIASANGCRPVHGNCVFIDRQPATVVAVTPTMLVVRAPFTCVAPVDVAARTRWSRGFGRATFCVLPPVDGPLTR